VSRRVQISHTHCQEFKQLRPGNRIIRTIFYLITNLANTELYDWQVFYIF